MRQAQDRTQDNIQNDPRHNSTNGTWTTSTRDPSTDTGQTYDSGGGSLSLPLLLQHLFKLVMDNTQYTVQVDLTMLCPTLGVSV